MTRFRRLALVALIVSIGSAAYAPAAFAAGKGGGGGGFLPAGDYHFTTQRADFNVASKDPSQPNVGIFVSQSTNVSTPEGGATTTTTQTQVFFNVSGYTVNGFGCVLLTRASDFSLSTDLQTATLRTTIDSTTPTCGPVSLPLPLTVSVSWTGVGPMATGRDVSRFECLTYSENTRTSDSSNSATATADLPTALGGSFTTTQASVGSRDQQIAAEGVANMNCGGGIGGKGSGPGALAAGKYQFTRTEANYSLFSSDPSQPRLNIGVSRNTSASNRTGSPSSSTSETDLFMSVSSSTVNGFGCFIVAPGDFTISSDLSTAALHTTLSSQTPTCAGFPQAGFPLPTTVDVTWTGAGPIATTRDSNTFECLDYTSKSTGLQTINNGGTATATVSGIPGSFTTVGGMGSNDTRIDAKGVPQTSCIVRG